MSSYVDDDDYDEIGIFCIVCIFSVVFCYTLLGW